MTKGIVYKHDNCQWFITHFRSNGNKGICFVELGNPKSKGFAGRGVRHPVLKDGYSTGKFIERNGELVEKDDSKIKFKRD